MTHDASEVFTMQLGRASAKSANKFLRSRGLQKSDRDDVIAAAMLWCWENRAAYSLTTTLETWFMNAVRDAYKNLQRHELPTSDESLDSMGGGDTTYAIAAAESSARVLLQALTPADREIAALTMEGYTRHELMKRGHNQYAIDSARARIKQLRRLVPDEQRSKKLIQTATTQASDDAETEMSQIDKELEKLDFAPPAGADCPPCWRCKWFEGLLPDGKRSTRMDIVDDEVRAAVAATEARKIDIAYQVRSGL